MLGPWIKINWKDMVKQEMARVHTDILGISELKVTGMGKFNSDDIISTTVGKNPLEELEQPSESTKKVWNAGRSPQSQQKKSEMQGATSKMTEWSLFVSKANISILQ